VWMREKDWVVSPRVASLRIEASEASVGPALLFSFKQLAGLPVSIIMLCSFIFSCSISALDGLLRLP